MSSSSLSAVYFIETPRGKDDPINLTDQAQADLGPFVEDANCTKLVVRCNSVFDEQVSLTITLADVAEYYVTQACDLTSGCRTLAGLTGDWRQIDQLASLALEWFKRVNMVGMVKAMLAATHRRLFIPNAVYIPAKDGKEGTDFDWGDCKFLLVDGEYSYSEVYTEEAWKNSSEPVYIQQHGHFFLPDGSEIPLGGVQLLPDTCIVKLPERQHWCEDVQEHTTRMFGVYALDRRQHFHLCEMCASCELWFLETQYEAVEDDELNEMILEGDGQTEPVTYIHVCDIEPMFRRGRRCRPGRLPESNHGGGYRLRGISAVTWNGVMEEIAEMRCNADI